MSEPFRALVTSDWHADATTAGLARYDDVERAAFETVDEAARQRCSHYLFLGDLTDPDEERWTRAVGLAVRVARALDERGISSYWLVGNHDVVEDGSGAHTLSALAALGGDVRCRVLDRPRAGVFDGSGVDYVALPYVARSHAYDPERYVREEAPKVLAARRPVVVLGHLCVAGVTPGSETEDMPRGREVFFPADACRETFADRGLLMLNGHYHRAQEHGGVWIPGSLERLTFGEVEHRPGWLVVEFP